jgi:hypothetical protein
MRAAPEEARGADADEHVVAAEEEPRHDAVEHGEGGGEGGAGGAEVGSEEDREGGEGRDTGEDAEATGGAGGLAGAVDGPAHGDGADGRDDADGRVDGGDGLGGEAVLGADTAHVDVEAAPPGAGIEAEGEDDPEGAGAGGLRWGETRLFGGGGGGPLGGSCGREVAVGSEADGLGGILQDEDTRGDEGGGGGSGGSSRGAPADAMGEAVEATGEEDFDGDGDAGYGHGTSTPAAEPTIDEYLGGEFNTIRTKDAREYESCSDCGGAVCRTGKSDAAQIW